MTLTDEEAREIVDILRRMSEYMSDCGNSRLLREDAKPCIAILESRIGQSDDLTTAYMSGFERGRDAGRKERG